jgi:hypothetical protein
MQEPHSMSGAQHLLWMLVIMFVASFIIGYIIMSVLISTNRTNNLNKIYGALLMAFLMVAVELGGYMVLSRQVGVEYLTIFVVFLLLALVTEYLIVDQVGIDQRQFMLGMIEHHQMAITMAQRQKAKENSPGLTAILDEIIKSQEREISEMRQLLSNLEVK